MNWDCFVCHATEDKETVARPLVEQLKNRQLRVWFDEDMIDWGEHLPSKISQGLLQSRFGIVILSQSFFQKTWANRELNCLYSLENGHGERILPVWHDVDAVVVNQYSSRLGDRRAVPTARGIEFVASALADAIEKRSRQDISPASSKIRLHPHSWEILDAARAGDGRITSTRNGGGYFLSAGATSFGPVSDPRTVALNQHCLQQLCDCSFVRQIGEGCFVLSHLGYGANCDLNLADSSFDRIPDVSPDQLPVIVPLMRAAVGAEGLIKHSSHSGGTFLSAGNLSMDSSNPRELAAWEAAVLEMSRQRLVVPFNNHQPTQIWQVTHLGYYWTESIGPLYTGHGPGHSE